MDHTLVTLLFAAGSLGVVHTLLGPDHYLPIIALSGANRWSMKKTAWVTGICGFIHIGLAFLIGILGLRMSEGISQLNGLEGFMNSFFGWLLMSFGILYMIIGIRKHVNLRYSTRWFSRMKTNTKVSGRIAFFPWLLFMILVFGPCEPLVPILLIPANNMGMAELLLVVTVFGISTIFTMIVLVLVPRTLLSRINLRSQESYLQMIAGVLIFCCGAGVQFLGM